MSTKRLRTALMTAACGAAALGPAAAQTLEERVGALEAKLDRILLQLEADPEALDEAGRADVREAAALVREHPRADAPFTIATGTQPAAIVPVSLGQDDFGEVDPRTSLERPLGFMAGDTEVIFGGYLKLDASMTQFTGGDLETNSLGRDFYIPALVPVGGEESDPVFDFNPRETRFLFAFKNESVEGHKIGGKIEFDFQVTNTPFENERVSNSFVPRMRQAFITVDNWLLGQTWSTFQDVTALPDNLEFIGPTEGTVFNRQPMIRYSRGGFQVALEQPETLITTENGGRVLPGDDVVPDLVVRYNKAGDWGHMSLAGIARQLRAEDNVISALTGIEDADAESALGWGVSYAGLLKVGARDDFRFMATYGEGIGRYIGVNIVNDVAVDLRGSFEPVPTVSGFASYRHFWSDRWRSNLSGGYFQADNPVDLVGAAVTEEVWSVRTNLIYSMSDTVDLGAELSHATRQTEGDLEGDVNKLLLSAKYGF